MESIKGFVRTVGDEELREYLEFRYVNYGKKEPDRLDRLNRDIILRESLEGHRKRK